MHAVLACKRVFFRLQLADWWNLEQIKGVQPERCILMTCQEYLIFRAEPLMNMSHSNVDKLEGNLGLWSDTIHWFS